MKPFEDVVVNLPRIVGQDDPKGGVLQPWVRELPLRYQGVLVSGIRGCDGAPKEDASKHLIRMIRRSVLNPADPRETLKKGGFFGIDHDTLPDALVDFFHSLDQYPLHYVTHVMHTSEVIAYCHPQECIRVFFLSVYATFCYKLHVNAETPEQMHERLTEDRIAKGTTETDFPINNE